jgi:hypothetical protein
MVTTRRMTAFLGLVFIVGFASAGDRTRTQVLDDGSRIEWNAAGNPVRFMDTSGKLFATNRSLQVEQVFDDGSRIDWSAAGNPVRFMDTTGKLFATNRSLQVEQVFDDGSRIEWSAAGNPVRATDTSGNVVGEKLTQTVAAR